MKPNRPHISSDILQCQRTKRQKLSRSALGFPRRARLAKSLGDRLERVALSGEVGFSVTGRESQGLFSRKRIFVRFNFETPISYAFHGRCCPPYLVEKVFKNRCRGRRAHGEGRVVVDRQSQQ